jgi:hypothetical protein
MWLLMALLMFLVCAGDEMALKSSRFYSSLDGEYHLGDEGSIQRGRTSPQ